MIKIIYHANCSDGFCAAYLFWLKFGDEAEYIPFGYSQELQLSRFRSDDEVYIVDFSFKQPILLDLATNVAKIVVLDHHKTAQDQLDHDYWPENMTVVFDLSKSGAMLAWEYLHKDEEPLLLVQYVQDRDLWKFELEDSEEITTYIQSVPFEFDEWHQLNEMVSTRIKKARRLGEAIKNKLAQQVKYAVRRAKEMRLGEHRVLAVNATENLSDIGHVLAEKSPSGISVCWYMKADGVYKYCLRSIKSVDCSVIAKQFGGGGHPQASGFESNQLEFKPAHNELLGKIIEVPEDLSQSGYIAVFGYDPNGGNTQAPRYPHYVVYVCDAEGNRLENENLRIPEERVKQWLTA